MSDKNYQNILKDLLDESRIQISSMSPVDWAEAKRIMTSDNSPIKGKFSFENSPYIKEPLSCLAPDHPASIVAFMKGAQLGITTGLIENGIGYIIDQHPGNILYLVGHDDLIKETGKRLDLMIDSTGIRSKIKSTVKRIRNTKSGDTDKMKEFEGGALKLGIANHKSIRQTSVRYGFFDDFESMKGESKESGDLTKLIEQRFASYSKVMKLFYISTPELKEGSNIENVYFLGDQRKYHIPCPNCKELIELLFFGVGEGVENAGGMKWELDKRGNLIDSSVVYECQKCRKTFDEENKLKLLNSGKWIATALPSRPGYYSYHLSALYAPPFMYDWTHYVRDYLEACPPGQEKDERKYQTFLNVCLGETYHPETKRIDANKLQHNVRKYQAGIIPESLSMKDGNGRIIMITCGVDLNGKSDDARIDFEVVAFSETGATYSIDHGSFGTFDKYENRHADRPKYRYEFGYKNTVWPLLEEYITQVFETDTGRKMEIMTTGIDSGYQTDWAYKFRNETKAKAICIKGDDDANRYLSQSANLKTYKNSRQMPEKLYLAQNQFSKDLLARYMSLNWNPESDKGQPEGFMNFPTPADGKYQYVNFFSHFAAEEKRMNKDGKFRWVKRKETKEERIENHLYDCRLYAMVTKDVVVDVLCKAFKVHNPSWITFVQLITNKQNK
jgi:phage terminase large subunit GpA-like protein